MIFLIYYFYHAIVSRVYSVSYNGRALDMEYVTVRILEICAVSFTFSAWAARDFAGSIQFAVE